MKYFFIIVFSALLFSQSIQINEVVSSNSSIFYDEDGDTPDWIEIYNTSNNSINLEGYGLSDDLTEKFKWRFPSVSINANDFLLVLASDKDKDNIIISWDGEITQGDTWRYFPGTSEPPSDWNTIAFPSITWSEGPSGFGYGDNDDNTTLNQIISVYVRKIFTIENVDEIGMML